MKLVILSEGGQGRGLGHVMRCLALAKAFEERQIHSHLFVDASGEEINTFLGSSSAKIFPWLLRRDEFMTETLMSSDLVIVDSYQATLEFFHYMAEFPAFKVFLDDVNRDVYPEGFVYNGAICARQLNYIPRKGIEYRLGPQYAVLRQPFWSVMDKPIERQVRRMLVTVGGVDTKEFMLPLLDMLQRYFPYLEKIGIVGPGFRHAAKIRAQKDRFLRIVEAPGADEMLQWMLKADLAVSSCGQTLQELARVGMPTIGVSVAENQKLPAEAWQESGFLEYIGHYDDPHLEESLFTAVNKLLNHPLRLTRSKNGKALIDGQGACRIVEELIQKSEISLSR